MPVITPFQTSYGFEVFSATPGQLADTQHREVSNKSARGLLRAGRMAFKNGAAGGSGSRNSIDPGEAYQIISGGAAADVDALGSFTSATGLKTPGSGVTGGSVSGALSPSRPLTVTFDASVDWDATTGVITYIDASSMTVSENVSIAPSAVFTSAVPVTAFISLDVPAQLGATGTATIGIGAAAAIGANDLFGVVIRQPIKTSVSGANLYGYPGVPTNAVEAHYVSYETVPLLTFGSIWVDCETAVADRDPVFVRTAAGAGGANLGTFRNDADGGSCVAVPNARFLRDSPAAGPAAAHFGSF